MLRRFGQMLVRVWCGGSWVAAKVAEAFGVLGARGAIVYLFKGKLLHALLRGTKSRFIPTIYRLYTRESRFPLLCRGGTSDLDTFSQVFVRRGYSCVPERPSGNTPKFIIDCGANVGYASAYFLERFPSAQVLAVEPDLENFRVLCRNLAPYGERAQALCAAVWFRKADLVVVRGRYRDGREWSTQVRERGKEEEPDVQAFSVGDLLDQTGFRHVDLLKVDIEGAEVEIFSKDYEGWIDKVGTFAIELHDERCREAFFCALREDWGAFSLIEYGELTVAERVSTVHHND